MRWPVDVKGDSTVCADVFDGLETSVWLVALRTEWRRVLLPNRAREAVIRGPGVGRSAVSKGLSVCS